MMGYKYNENKPWMFSDEGQRIFLRVRDFSQKALQMSGAVRCQELMDRSGAADPWHMLACVDRLVELGEIIEIPTTGPAQHRVFVSGKP